MENIQQIKNDILQALAHVEACEGLYFRNFAHLHEEDERPAVRGTEEQILDALRHLIDEGKIRVNEDAEELVFFLK